MGLIAEPGEIDFTPFDFNKYRTSSSDIIDDINKLVKYNERQSFPRFANTGKLDDARHDEKIMAHYGLIYKELLKSCLEGFYEYQLDNDDLIKQLRSLSADKYGGVDYYNYQFSDAYDDEDRCTDKPLNNTDMKNYAKLSVSDAESKYGIMNIGDLIVTPEMLAFVKEMRSIGRIPDGNIIRDERRYNLMMEAAQALAEVHPEWNGHPIMCLSGGFAGEMGWRFDEAVINEAERASGGNGTQGLHNCGEGWIGFTFWTSKIKWITKYNLPCPKSPEAYDAAGEGIKNGMKLSACPSSGNNYIIASLPFQEHAKLVAAYMQDRISAGPWLYRWNENMNKPGAANEAMGASYMSKHGEGFAKQCNTWWDKAVHEGRREINTSVGVIKRSGFGCHVYQAMMFARWVKDGKVPTSDPWL